MTSPATPEQVKATNRRWTMADVNLALSGTVAAMAQGSFDLIATGAMLFTVGVYVDGQKAADVAKMLGDAMATLNYGKSSKYALTAAALDVGRDLVKRYGRPDTAEPNIFWQMIAESVTVAEGVALFISAIKTEYGVNTVDALYKVLRPAQAAKPKAEKPLVDKARDLVADATPAQAASVATSIIAERVAPSDMAAMILNIAGNLSADQLADVMVSLGDMVSAKMIAESEAAKLAA